MRAVELMFLIKKYRKLTNPLATFIIFPLAATPVVTALFVWPSNKNAIFAFIFYFTFFAVSYYLGLLLAKRYAKNPSQKFAALALSAFRARVSW